MNLDQKKKITDNLEAAIAKRRKPVPSVPILVCAAFLTYFLSNSPLAKWFIRNLEIYDYVFADGWIPDVLLWVFWFVVLDLFIFKLFFRGITERAALRKFPLVASIPYFNKPETEHAYEYMVGLSKKLKESASEFLVGPSFWLKRTALGLLRFFKGDSKENVREALKSQADADETASASEYLLVKVLIWAMPLLGFIGTVEGISSGIADFSHSLDDQLKGSGVIAVASASPPESAASDDGGRERGVKQSLMKVTDGLGRAFATTFAALLYTVIAMLLLTFVEKREGDRLNRFREKFETVFVGNLPESRNDFSIENLDEWGKIAKRIEEGASRNESSANKMDSAQSALEEFTERAKSGIGMRVFFDEKN